ncbi:DUF6268 family outer membrane beta-barrel protein [Zhouia sp. PK063]|uniref:DUF6268 family outer membrane beta-barrel protein n=1 Tax=Zhouia sp. PK063 TaxID=3373602 RepID=UPI0037898505
MRKLIFIAFVCFAYITSAQTTDIGRVEYMNMPNSNGNTINRYRVLAQMPFAINKEEKEYIVFGMEYRYLDLSFQDNLPFSTADISSTQRMEASLGYTFNIKEHWRLAFRAGARIESNLNSKLVSDDFIYIGDAYIIHDMTKAKEAKKPYRWIFGLAYTTTPGRNYPLPLINYYREFAPKWTYTLGVPKTNIRYKFDKKNHLQAFVTLDNFFANIQQNKMVNGKLAENISMTAVIGGLGYEHYFKDHFLFYLYGGYTIYKDYRLRDNQRNDVYTIDDNGTFYVRTGLKLKVF